MGRFRLGLLAGIAVYTAGCRSAYVETVLVNRTSTPISVLEMDYPSASFGTQMLAPGATFRYRFKVLGSGPLKLTYTDSKQQEHTATGPSISEGEQGSLLVSISPSAVDWQPKLSRP